MKSPLQSAATRIKENPSGSVEIKIDSDTQGVPGTPPITETILKKIEACDLFIPDLTFVAKTADGKYVPNPNVMAEFGYALHAKTHAALMPIMNIAFGPPERLPFDLGHLRHPTRLRSIALSFARQEPGAPMRLASTSSAQYAPLSIKPTRVI